MRFLPVLALALGGCELGHECTLMYAPDSLTVTFDGDFTPGDYVFTMSGDDSSFSCEVVFPDDGSGVTIDDVTCDPTLMLQLDASGTGVDSLMSMDFAPDEVTVGITKDGASLAEQTFQPDYTVDEPNGEGCGERRSAEITLSF